MAAAERPLRALIVDDEAPIRNLLARSLGAEGFVCDTAEDGHQAWDQVQRDQYDAVITDLRMPNRHGHSLAVQLLTLSRRPLIVVLTGLLEPRMAKDLLARGIDDIAFKPVEFATFAAKVRSLLNRRRQQDGTSPANSGNDTVVLITPPSTIDPISAKECEDRVHAFNRIPTISHNSIEIFKLTMDASSDVASVAAAAQRDPSLITELLRMANSAFFNPAGKKVTDTREAVTRLGQKRVGELALTTAALASITQEKVPFFSLPKIWRECLAAGICLEMLVDQTLLPVEARSGLFCATVLQPMGRIMLASAFPEVYSRLIKQAADTGKALRDLESEAFPSAPGQVIANVLANWGIPEEIIRPLRHTALSFAKLASLPESLRHRVELIKTACFLGKLTAGSLERWNAVDLPVSNTLKRLRIHSVDSLLQQSRHDLAGMSFINLGKLAGKEILESEPSRSPVLLAYKRLHVGGVDFIPELLGANGIKLVNVADEIPVSEIAVLYNTLNTPLPQIVARLRSSRSESVIILAEAENAERLQQYGRIITLPVAYGALCDLCTALGHPSADDLMPLDAPSVSFPATRSTWQPSGV